MSELIAVSGMTLTPSDPTVVATINVLTAPQVKEKCEGSGIYVHNTVISVSAITVQSAGATIPDAGPYVVVIEATGSKVKAEAALVLREGDSSETINAIPKIPGSPPVDYPVPFTVDITVAGQTKVKAE